VETKQFLAPRQIGVPHWQERLAGDGRNELAQLSTTLAALQPAVLTRLNQTHQVVCHNDFFGPNLLVTGGQLSGLVDFDFCLTASHLVDVVEGLHGAVLDSSHGDDYYWLWPARGW